MSQPWLLPTPLVALLVRSVPVRGRQILAQHLRNPDYLRELTDEDRAEAARVVVQRLAQSGRAKATLRQRAVTDDIALPADFDFGTLSREARAAIHDALGRIGPDRLAGLTWGELLDKKRKAPPRHALLLALGELEWLVAQRSVPTLDRHRSDVLRTRLGALLGDSRLDLVLANDFRLGWRRFGEAPRLGKLLAGWASAATLTATQERYVERLTEVFAMSLADDISDIGRCLAQAAFTNRDARGRAAEVFAARFGVRPYGPAHALPFHALPFEGEPLGVSRVISYLPSASTLQFVKPELSSKTRDRILSIGNPTAMAHRNPLTGEKFPARALPAAAAEAAFTAALFPQWKALIGG
ncbi:MAG: hypothetical protein MUE79_08100, partial [Nitratireductor sp.]|nr:hypothetical protein [Nitratireductor sp.]